MLSECNCQISQSAEMSTEKVQWGMLERR